MLADLKKKTKQKRHIKDCFNRTAFAPSQLWMCMFLFFSVGVAAVQTIGFWVEYRLGFGAACSSGIAQRWVQMLVYDFQTELDAEEEPIFEAMLTDLPGDDPRVRWIRTRRTLSQRSASQLARRLWWRRQALAASRRRLAWRATPLTA